MVTEQQKENILYVSDMPQKLDELHQALLLLALRVLSTPTYLNAHSHSVPLLTASIVLVLMQHCLLFMHRAMVESACCPAPLKRKTAGPTCPPPCWLRLYAATSVHDTGLYA